MNTSEDSLQEFIYSEPEIIIEKILLMYPQLAWEIVKRDETAYVDDDVKDRLIGLVTSNIVIFDFFSSECGRFSVNPEKTYGVPAFVAEAISKYNNFNCTEKVFIA